ncbi:Hypothetical protein LUCI_2049 [Lucifera butyrica]|uniref:HD domain-containing protein n=1 Tax=Lucifera butyrica TaxID=1351585 RepID=A0A498R967_9FIRM|nr:HD domain-containing protein [Lucifera butyrica]VBB06812.1 Hypothetical protein LUCI_2049 [Lucifera butyrica]
MQSRELNKLYDWFGMYVASFNTPDQEVQSQITLKREHTLRVVQYSVELARHLVLSPADQQLAEVIALFHDIGRFKQYTLYRTFSDSQSEDHAVLGLREIAALKELGALAPEETECFRFAVSSHNAVKIPVAASAREKLFASIIRDTDKLDIYYVLEPFLSPPAAEGCSKILVEDLLAGRQSHYTDMKTPDDRKLIRLSWIYDINYDWTLKRIYDQGYVDKIAAHLPATKEIAAAVDQLRSYIDARLSKKR